MTETQAENDKPADNRTAWIRKIEFLRKGRRGFRWIEEGTARVEPDGDVTWVNLHSLPIGGFDGCICLTKIGDRPPDINLTPQRPDAAGGDDGQGSED